MPLRRRQLLNLSLALLALTTPLFSLRAAELTPAPTHRLVVRVSTLRNDHGNLLISVFHGGDGFPDNGDKALTCRVVPIPKGASSVTIPFDGLATGEYAVSLFHDENTNGKLDTRWGIPTEGFGVSNNPRIHWGAPTYKEAHFSLGDSPETTIAISLRYLRGGGKH